MGRIILAVAQTELPRPQGEPMPVKPLLRDAPRPQLSLGGGGIAVKASHMGPGTLVP